MKVVRFICFVVEDFSHNFFSDLIGRLSEMIVSLYLSARGYTLLQRRYRNPHCELDLITIKEKALFFVEVKFRGSLFSIENTIHYSSLEKMYNASESFCDEFREYYHFERVFKVFLMTPSLIRVITL